MVSLFDFSNWVGFSQFTWSPRGGSRMGHFKAQHLDILSLKIGNRLVGQ